MKRTFVCLLALCAAVLTACGHPAATLPLEGGEPAVSPAPEPWEITGQLAEYTGGHVDMALTIPDGWTWGDAGGGRTGRPAVPENGGSRR